MGRQLWPKSSEALSLVPAHLKVFTQKPLVSSWCSFPSLALGPVKQEPGLDLGIFLPHRPEDISV